MSPRQSSLAFSKSYLQAYQVTRCRKALQVIIKWTPHPQGEEGEGPRGHEQWWTSYPIGRAFRQTSKGMVSGRSISNLGRSQSHWQGTKILEISGGSNIRHSFCIYIPSLWKTFYNKILEKSWTCSPNLDTLLFLSEPLRLVRAGRNPGDCSRE